MHARARERERESREGQRPTECRSTGLNRDRQSYEIGRTGLGPVSVRSSKLFGSGPNYFLKRAKSLHSRIPARRGRSSSLLVGGPQEEGGPLPPSS